MQISITQTARPDRDPDAGTAGWLAALIHLATLASGDQPTRDWWPVVAAELRTAMNAAQCLIAQQTAANQPWHILANAGEPLASPRLPSTLQPAADQALQTKTGIIATSRSTAAAEFNLPASHLVLPLPPEADRPAGIILALTGQPSRLFAAEDLQWGELATRQIALLLEQARLKHSHREIEGRLQAVLENSGDGIVWVGLDRRIRVLNSAALTALHLPGTPEAWAGRPLRTILPHLQTYAPEASRLMRAEMRRVRRGDEAVAEGELEVPPRVFRWRNLPVANYDSLPSRLLVLRDTTQERQLAALREELTHMMVHDLRSPLGTITTALEFLEYETQGALSPEAQQTLGIVRESAQMTLELVNAILDLNQLENGKLPLDFQPVSLTDLCGEVVRLLQPDSTARQLRLHNTLPAELPLVRADRGLLSRVVHNLLNNAVKFTPSNGLIQLSALVEARQPPHVVVMISDTGPGIPAALQARLFQKFSSGPSAPGQSRRGSGLGLAFCKLVIEAHGGQIWAESPPGRGARFVFTLPVIDDAAEPPLP